MSFRTIMLVSAGVGIAAGAAIAPFEVKLATSLTIWWLVGVVLGYLNQDRRTAVYSGALYGAALTLSFILLEIGLLEGIFVYALLLLMMCLTGATNGAVASLIGLELKQRVNLKLWIMKGIQLWQQKFGQPRY